MAKEKVHWLRRKVNDQGKKEFQEREEREEVMARERERESFGRGEKENAPLDALYKRKERERVSTPWKERGKFDRRERENFNRGERERALAKGKESMYLQMHCNKKEIKRKFQC